MNQFTDTDHNGTWEGIYKNEQVQTAWDNLSNAFRTPHAIRFPKPPHYDEVRRDIISDIAVNLAKALEHPDLQRQEEFAFTMVFHPRICAYVRQFAEDIARETANSQPQLRDRHARMGYLGEIIPHVIFERLGVWRLLQPIVNNSSRNHGVGILPDSHGDAIGLTAHLYRSKIDDWTGQVIHRLTEEYAEEQQKALLNELIEEQRKTRAACGEIKQVLQTQTVSLVNISNRQQESQRTIAELEKSARKAKKSKRKSKTVKDVAP